MLNRRQLLRGAMATLAAYPFVSSLVRRKAAADTGVFPKRFVCVYTPNGHHQSQWPTAMSGSSIVLPTELASFAPIVDRIAVLKGVAGSYGHHAGHSESLTGRPQQGFDSFLATGGPSLDQLLAKDAAGQTPVASIELGVSTGTNASGIINYSEAGYPIPSVNDARAGFERAFGDVLAAGNPEQAEKHRQLDLRIVDKLARDVGDAVTHLDADERALLEAHLDLLHDHEEKLKNPAPEKLCDPEEPGSGLDFPSTTKAHIDTIVQAFSCDVTRVATLVVGPSGSIEHYTWANADVDFHETAHGAVGDALTMMSRINGWHAQQVAYLIEQLSAVSEGDGTLLDNTLVFWTNELGVHPFDHHREEVPVLLAGGMLNTGAIINASAHYHDVLLTLAHAMGHTELTSFGDLGNTVLSALLA